MQLLLMLLLISLFPFLKDGDVYFSHMFAPKTGTQLEKTSSDQEGSSLSSFNPPHPSVSFNINNRGLNITFLGGNLLHAIRTKCSMQSEQNAMIFIPSYVATMENINNQHQNSRFGISMMGSGPDASYGLAQCYGDLSTFDGVLYYTEARTILSKCFPYNGRRIFHDGCFMRAENYNFFQEYTYPNDRAMCGNKTIKGMHFETSVKQAILDTTSVAVTNVGYARAAMVVAEIRNESAYVLAEYWKSLNSSSCKACLKNTLSYVTRMDPGC